MKPAIQVFTCGQKDCAHQWDGPGVEWINPCAWCAGTGSNDEGTASCARCKGTGEGGHGGSATCSKCGVDAMSVSLWEGP